MFCKGGIKVEKVTDEEFFSALKTVFNVLPDMLSMEVHIALTDRERYVMAKPAESTSIQGILRR